jgi:hypothetical protein
VGWACSTHGRGEKSVQGFGGKAHRKDPAEDQGVDGRIVSEWIVGRLDVRMLSGLNCLRKGVGGGLL